MRSVYSGSAIGGTPIGEGTSLGFRKDYFINATTGFAFGAEQLIHFDGKQILVEIFTLLYPKLFGGKIWKVSFL